MARHLSPSIGRALAFLRHSSTPSPHFCAGPRRWTATPRCAIFWRARAPAKSRPTTRRCCSLLPRRSENTVLLVWPGGRSEQVTLEATGMSGGAGEIFTLAGRPDYVAKIYHASASPAHLAQYQRKIRWMADYRPALPAVPAAYAGIVQLAWPEALLLRQSQFVGFAMQKIDFERTLELDYLLNRRQAAQEGFDADYGKLATVAFNLASVISCLHDMHIAVVDLKPMNVKVYKAELYV